MKRRRLTALLLAAVMCFSMTGCGARQSKYGSAFRFPLCAEPAQLDPQMADDAASIEVLCATMEGLTRLSADGDLLPGIAETWDTSDDGKTVTFALRDAVWSNGEKVTADDFAFAFERAVDPATRSPLKEKFANIVSAVATDARTFTVTLADADADFAQKMASSAFFPCHRAFFESTAGHYGMEAEYVLANGGFTLSSWTHGDTLILRKNQKYYASEEILPDAVRYMLNVSEEETVSLLQTEGLSAAAVTEEQLAAVKRAGLHTATVYDGLYALWFNTENDALSSAATRLALCAAVDRERVASVWGTERRTAVGFVPPDALCGGVPYVDEADSFAALKSGKQRLAEMPQLTLLCGEDSESVAIAREILQNWQKRFSLYFKMEKLPVAELSDRLQSGDYELALGTVVSVGGTAAESLTMFASKSEDNVTGLADKTFDALLQKALADETRDACKKAEERLYASCPCLPLYYPARTFAFGDGVEGVNVHPFGGGVFGAVYDFRAATK